MPSRIAQVAISAQDPQAVAEFWCAALDWVVLEVEDGVVWCIGPADASVPGIDVGPSPEDKTIKNRLHLDLRADGVSTQEELDRLLGLGARRVDIGQDPDAPWTVLADPEGNEFCLLHRTIQELAATPASPPSDA